MEFYSKSAQSSKEKDLIKAHTRLINIRPYFNPTIMWIGNVEDDLIHLGVQLGFDNRLFSGSDLSVLLHAKVVVMRNCEISAAIVGFIKNYGIPLIWFGQTDVPIQWIQSFDLIAKYDSPQSFYGGLCKLIV